MTLLFLNQYGPGDPSPTAKLLRDLADHLTAAGHDVQVASSSVDYRQRPARGVRRWLRELAGLFRIFFRALFCKSRPDVVISFTSPPGLIVFATLVAMWHRARSVHWALDLYPDLAMALDELDPGSHLAGAIVALTRWAYGRTDTVVTLDADMQKRLQRWGVEAEIIAPWPPIRSDVTVEITPSSTPCWLYSGNLGRAHEWEALLEIQKIVEDRDSTLELVIQGGGAARAAAQARAIQLGLKRCHWRDYTPEENLLPGLFAANVLVVTQRPEARGMLWPSKLAVLLKMPRPILWIGSTASSAARVICEHPGSDAFESGDTVAAADWLLRTVQGQSQGSFPTRFTFQPDSQSALEKWQKIIERAA